MDASTVTLDHSTPHPPNVPIVLDKRERMVKVLAELLPYIHACHIKTLVTAVEDSGDHKGWCKRRVRRRRRNGE